MTSEQTALKRVIRFAAGGTPSVGETQFWTDDAGTPWVATGDMTAQPVVRHTDRRVTLEGIASKRLPVGKKGTVLFAMYASVGAVSVLGMEASWNQPILGMEPIPSLADQRFLVYWLLSLRPRLQEYFRSNTQDNLNAEQVGNLPYPVLPVAQQRAIADYLDAETARIDALIEKKRRQQAVLLEHEEAVLLDRLGDWRAEPDKTLRQYGATAVTGPFGTQLAASEYISGGTPVVNPTHIERGRFKPEEEVTVSGQVAARLRRHQLFEGDIVLGRKGDVGRSAIVTPKEAGWICGSDSIALRTDKTRLIPEFLVRLLSIDLYRQQLQATSTGTTMANVNQATLLGLCLPALSVSEQNGRLASAERAIARHEALIMTLDRQIELLTEHRQALITAAVTGQVEM